MPVRIATDEARALVIITVTGELSNEALLEIYSAIQAKIPVLSEVSMHTKHAASEDLVQPTATD